MTGTGSRLISLRDITVTQGFNSDRRSIISQGIVYNKGTKIEKIKMWGLHTYRA